MNIRVYVTGSEGLVGRALMPELAKAGWSAQGNDLPALDVRSERKVRQALGVAGSLGEWRNGGPEWIVNLAAITDVDGCEEEPGGRTRAEAANVAGAENVARVAVGLGATLLQVSTDYVFDGSRREPYREDAEPAPLSVYGRTKLEAEKRARRFVPEDRLLIVRGQSLYGDGRKSFPDAILAAAAAKPVVPVVTDQVVQPTWARDFAQAMVALMAKEARGVFHFASSGSCTWNEFACAVLEEEGLDPARITGTTAAALARPAPRPAWSVFDTGRFEAATGVRPRPWREQLREYLRSRKGTA